MKTTIIRVFEWREHKRRLEIARVSRAVREQQAHVAALRDLIAGAEQRARANASARFAEGPRSVAALLELEHSSESLRAAQQELVTLLHRTEQRLEALSEHRRALIRRWRREESKLTQASRLARDAALRVHTRRLEAAEQEQAEQHTAIVRTAWT